MPLSSAARIEFALDNGNKFYIRRYDAFLSLKILGELQKRFIAPFLQILEASRAATNGEDHFGQAIERLSRNLDGDSLVDIIKKICHPDYITIVINGEDPEKFDEGLLNRSIDDISDLIMLVKEVIVYNYQSLFTRGKILIGQAQETMAKE